ncbi:MAG: TetR family transcriptional regulator [Myxococcales bacterium]|nr:TetR family transcriptional regulator [Myxococcales bacterium]
MSSSVQVEALPRSEQRRRAIMRATLRVVAEGGLDRVTHRRVAAAAGVPLGSTTYYFASRDDLIRQSFQLYLDESTKVLGDLAREYPEITVENLVAYLVELARREFERPGLVLAEYELILAAARDASLARDLKSWERGRIAELAEWLEQIGASRPVESARSVLQLMRGYELESLTRPDPDPEDLGRRLSVLIRAFVDS